ncbi:thiamine pyrophosphate-binding protein [Ectothiorhodospiraceae bacterium BW-2]|nr:thiamine pyrophosphate-binding protein [Ectothiorhodospiraceae bacterium BW-2]
MTDKAKLPVSHFIVRYMERLGIEAIFGMPGAHILPVYDALYESKIETVLAKHEQGAAFMAGGYSRASGRIGACITTAGPGATNLITGIANAYADKQPILVITGETSTHIFGKGGLQESSGEGGSIDQVTLFKGITRYNKIVERTDYLVNVLNQASQVLLSDTPGPVLLSLPFNIQRELIEESLLDQITTQRRHFSLYEESLPVKKLAQLLLQSRQTVIIAGFGALQAGARHTIEQLSQQLQIPVATTLKAKGVINETSSLSLGSLGVTSSGEAYRYICQQADTLLFLGASFNERTSYLWESELLDNRTLIQVDLDPNQLNKLFQADLAIQGDINKVIEGVLQQLPPQPQRTSATKAPAIATTRPDYALFQSGFSLIEHFFQQLAEHFPADIQVFDDNIIFAQNFFQVSSQNHYYPNSGISSLGHAIPAAIGARFVTERPTFAILGDGGFQMCCMELMTAVNYQKPLNVLVFNNGTMGLIRKNQHQHYQSRYINCDFINPDLRQLAAALGICYYLIETEADTEMLFERADLKGSINLIEMVIDKNLFPNYSSKR